MFLRRRLHGFLIVAVAVLSVLVLAPVAPGQPAFRHDLHVIDAETGFDVPAQVHSAPGLADAGVEVLDKAAGRISIRSSNSRHQLLLNAPGYQPAAIVLDSNPADPFRVIVKLNAQQPHLDFQTIERKLRADSTLIVGFVGDEQSGVALSHVRVRALPANVDTETDASGYFELSVPCSRPAPDSSQLSFEKPGFETEVRQNLELWPGGDWTYRVQLSRGSGRKEVDERQTRRWSVKHPGIAPVVDHNQNLPIAEIPARAEFVPAGTSASNLTIRVPQMIRVLYTNAVFYETLENYCRHVLPSEWISSWGSYPAGSNSLQAGAVALRTYAIGYVNQPLASTYDICATTSCQVYNPAVTSSRTDQAVAQTAGYVMINSTTAIPRGLTEYSAENNQLGMSCGDGFTAPTGGCLADPVCAGEAEFGHGRGMCQWGTVKWATGLKFPGNNFSNTTLTNGQPRRDWIWIAQHYYPNLTLVRGTSLVVGDDVRATTANLNVRRCPGDSITNGGNCPSVATVPLGAPGVVLAGPEQILTDGNGYVWWYVQWNTGAVGWVVENYLARIIPVPPAPTGLTAVPLSSTRIQLAWNDLSDLESGFKIERALSANGTWTEIDRVVTNVSAYVASNLSSQTTYFFRVRAFNLGGDSAYSGTGSATTPGNSLVLEPIPDQSIEEEKTLQFVAKVANGESVQTLADFESFLTPPPNGTALFRVPGFSGSTSGFLDASPNVSAVTGALPPGQTSTRALAVSCSFSNAANGWLRLTTSGAATTPNPVIDFTKKFRLDVYTDREVRMGLGLRETTNAVGTPIGSDGGTLGAIEWAGVSGRLNGQPQPVRHVTPGTWQTLTFDLPREPVSSFVNGDGVLATASGLGVLEHLAIVPMDGVGIYNIFLDNFAGVDSRLFHFSLEPGAPEGAAVGSITGAFSWTPTETQGPSNNMISIRVMDDSPVPQTDVKTFKVVVQEVNQPPVAVPLEPRWIHVGTTLWVTNTAVDPDLPVNALMFNAAISLPVGATLDGVTGVLRWQVPDGPTEATNVLAIRITDNGSPSLSTTNLLVVRTSPRPRLQPAVTAEGRIELRWTGIPGRRYQVQYADAVDAENWVNAGEPVTASAVDIVVDQPPVIGQRFFRLLLIE